MLDKCYITIVLGGNFVICVFLFQGGWENDETVEQAAAREAVEEAGVRGDIVVRYIRDGVFKFLLLLHMYFIYFRLAKCQKHICMCFSLT